MPVLRDDLRAASQPQAVASPIKAAPSPKNQPEKISRKKSAKKNKAAN
jgi:hypothetical protein